MPRGAGRRLGAVIPRAPSFWQGSPVSRALSLAALVAAIGCGEPPASTLAALPIVREQLGVLGLAVEPIDEALVPMAWQAPPRECPHVYRIDVNYAPPQALEADSSSSLGLQLTAKAPDTIVDGAPIPDHEVAPLEMFYQGLRVERRGTVRDLWLSRSFAGPAAPTAACMPRTWDPMEDALALGWPLLPRHFVAVGATWTGLRVEGKCNRSACVDPDTGGGGPDQHHRVCVTPSWSETLLGVYEIGSERFAWVESRWSDGQPPDKGIWTERRSLISIDHGRPAWSQTKIHHGFPQMAADRSFAPVERTWTMTSIDTCPGSLATAGWDRPEDAAREATRVAEQLANADELRRIESASRRPEETSEPFAPAGPPQ